MTVDPEIELLRKEHAQMAYALNVLNGRTHWRDKAFGGADNQALANVIVRKGFDIAKQYDSPMPPYDL